jgi:hypothetical protein
VDWAGLLVVKVVVVVVTLAVVLVATVVEVEVVVGSTNKEKSWSRVRWS